MSEITIFDKSQEIRFETELYANTCERVANVLDDINDTKANKVDVSASIQAVLDELALLEESIYTYVDDQDNDLRALINTKLTKPAMSTISDTFYYIRARVGLEPDYLPFNISTGRVPYWSGTSFFSSPITINSIYVGINKDSPTEALDVAGSVRANSFKYNIQTANSVPLKTWTDGSDLWFTDQTGVDKKLGTGLNISNANLSNAAARTFTQGAAFTWDTAGKGYYLKGLLDKTNQAAYSKVVIVHPTTGETVTRDFADPSATTLAVQNASTAQKTAMRTALLGTATPANPVIFAAAPRFVTRGEVLIDLYGINLTLLDPVFIWIERADSSKIYASTFYNLTPTGFTTQWLLPADLPNGAYTIFIQNGVTVAGLSTGVIEVIDFITPLYFPTADWKRRNRLNSSGVEQSPGGTRNSHSDNIIQMSSIDTPGYIASDPQTWVGMSYKTLNIFLGSKDWDIKILIDPLVNSGSAREMPMIGLTETTHSGFTATTALIPNKFMIDMINTYKLSPSSPGFSGYGTLYISKSGNQLFFRLYNHVTLTNFSFYQTTIDTSKDYALFINDNTIGVGGSNWSWRRYTVEARIMN